MAEILAALAIEFVGFVLLLGMLGFFLLAILKAIDPSKAADRRAGRREGSHE